MEASLPMYKGLPARIWVVPGDQRERRRAAYDADHYEVCGYCITVRHESFTLW